MRPTMQSVLSIIYAANLRVRVACSSPICRHEPCGTPVMATSQPSNPSRRMIHPCHLSRCPDRAHSGPGGRRSASGLPVAGQTPNMLDWPALCLSQWRGDLLSQARADPLSQGRHPTAQAGGEGLMPRASAIESAVAGRAVRSAMPSPPPTAAASYVPTSASWAECALAMGGCGGGCSKSV